MFTIYMIKNTLNGKQYIGQTRRDLKWRIADHLKCVEVGMNTELYNSIRKHRWENFEVIVIDQSAKTQEDLNRLETYYIDLYDTYEHGYNMCRGGDSNSMDAPEVRHHHDAVMRSDDVRNRISESMKRYRANETSEQKRLHNLHSGEGQKRAFAAGKVRHYKVPQHLEPDHKQKLMDSHNKAVYCINESGEVVAEFSRVRDAAKWWMDHGHVKVADWYGTGCGNIKKSANEDRYIYGLKWFYRV